MNCVGMHTLGSNMPFFGPPADCCSPKRLHLHFTIEINRDLHAAIMLQGMSHVDK